jgi:dUTP pyrophosphatase
MKILINKLHPDAHFPAYAHGPLEDAGLDLRAVERGVLEPGVAQAVPTGIAIELPPGCEAQVRPRSGMALKHSLTVNFGTIDPGYRGEIRVVMFNLGRANYTIEKGDRIAQLVVARYEAIEWEEGQLGRLLQGHRRFWVVGQVAAAEAAGRSKTCPTMLKVIDRK